MKRPVLLGLVLLFTATPIFQFGFFCNAAGITLNGNLESDIEYRELQSFEDTGTNTLYTSLLNLKMEFNSGEKQSGFIWLQPTTDPLQSNSFIINQAYVDCASNTNSLLRIGRQKFSWGTGFAWNPTNYIGSGKNRADLLTGNLQGVDAIHYEKILGNSYLVIALIAEEELKNWGEAAKFGFNLFHSDFSISAYSKDGAYSYGADFATGIGNYTVYSELAMKSGSKFYIQKNGADYSKVYQPSDQHYLYGVIGANRTFDNNLLIQLEYYYNQEGWGSDDAPNFYDYMSVLAVSTDPADLLLLQQLGLAKSYDYYGDLQRNYLFLMIRKDNLVEDLALIINGIWNMDDKSYQLTPMIQYQLGQNTTITLMANFFNNDQSTEFGSLPFTFQFIGKLSLSF